MKNNLIGKMAAIICSMMFGLNLTAAPVFANTDPDYPVTTDLWDISRGTIVTGWSAYPRAISNDSLDPMFGGSNGYPTEPENAMFFDGRPEGYTHWVEWQTQSPVQINHFHLFATHDSEYWGSGRYPRSFDHVALYYKSGNTFISFFDRDITVPYNSTYALFLDENVITQAATQFRAEFRIAQLSHGWWTGPRINELDAFGTAAVPEPVSSLLLVMGGTLLTVGKSLRKKL